MRNSSQSSLLNILATRTRHEPFGYRRTDRSAFRNGIEPFERFAVIRVERETLRRHARKHARKHVIRLERPV